MKVGTGFAPGHCCPPGLVQGGQESYVISGWCEPSLRLSLPVCEMDLKEHARHRTVGRVPGDDAQSARNLAVVCGISETMKTCCTEDFLKVTVEGELGSAQGSSWLFLSRKEGCAPWRGHRSGVGPMNGGEVGSSAFWEGLSCGLELRDMAPRLLPMVTDADRQMGQG